MRFALLLSTATLSCCLAHQHADGDANHEHSVSHYCGATDPTLGEMRASDRMVRQWLADHPCDSQAGVQRNPHCPATNTNDNNYDNPDGNSRQSTTPPITIQVKWHSVAQDDGDAAASMEQIMASVEGLNVAFAHPTTGGFRFEFDMFSDYTYSENTDWHFAERFDLSPKEALRQGDCTTLNIYSTGSFENGGPFGWAPKPFECENDDEEENPDCYNVCALNMVDDGVVVRYDLVAGGPNEMYDEGDVLVHEVGHWLGLYHTFQNGCDSPGDFIFDTPAEREPAWGCDEPKDTCEDSPGMDPIHNYMNLSNDPCMFEFTDGQFAWMYATWETYRASLAMATPNPTIGLPGATPSPTFTQVTTPPVATPAPIQTPAPFFTLAPVFVTSTVRPTIAPTDVIPTIPSTPMPTNIATPQPTPMPTLITTPRPTLITTPQPTLPSPSSPPNIVSTQLPTPLNQQKVAPEPKCGTLASQSGYGGSAAQSKDCTRRGLRGEGDDMEEPSRRRRIKGL